MSNIKTSCTPVPVYIGETGKEPREQTLGEVLNTIEGQQDNILSMVNTIDTALLGEQSNSEQGATPVDGCLDRALRIYATNNQIASVLDHILGRL